MQARPALSTQLFTLRVLEAVADSLDRDYDSFSAPSLAGPRQLPMDDEVRPGRLGVHRFQAMPDRRPSA